MTIIDFRIFGDNNHLWMWLIFIPIVIFIVTAVSNAANLTDGLDGLATGVSAIIAITLAVLAYVSGNAIVADYLNIFICLIVENWLCFLQLSLAHVLVFMV